MNIDLSIDGPHSDEYSRTVADGLSECVRVLNHATQTDRGAPYPDTVNTIVGHAHGAMYGMGQLFEQCATRLGEQLATGRLYDNGAYDDPDRAQRTAEAAIDALARARRAVTLLVLELADVHAATSRLGIREEGQ